MNLTIIIWPLLIIFGAVVWVALASAIVALMGRSRFDRE